MALLFHKSFAADLTEFSATNVSNGTIVWDAAAGLNGTSGGVALAATGASPSASGYVQHAFSGNAAMRLAWFTDLTSLLINADSNFVTLWNLRNVSDGNALARIRVGRASGVQRVYFDTFPDGGGTPSQDIAFILKPRWIEVEIVREVTDGSNNGEMRVYFGGGDYPAMGQKVAEFLAVQNFIVYNATTQARMGMFFGTTDVAGSMKLDEITAMSGIDPILFGRGSPLGNRLGLDLGLHL